MRNFGSSWSFVRQSIFRELIHTKILTLVIFGINIEVKMGERHKGCCNLTDYEIHSAVA